MENLRFGFAFGGVLLALISSLSAIDLSSYAFAMFAALVILSLKRLNSMALMIVGLSAIAAVSVLLLDGTNVDLRAAAFIFAFLLASGGLRVAASSEATVQNLGLFIAQSPQRHQFVAISLGTGLLALALLNGALQFVCGIFSEKSDAPLSQRLPIMRSIIAGFALNPILSPIAIPFVVMSSMLPAMTWVPLAPYLLACALVVWASGALQIRSLNYSQNALAKSPDTRRPTSFPELGPAIGLVLVPVIATILLVLAFGLKPSHAAFTSIFLSSLIWPLLRLGEPGLVFSGYTVAINEAAVIGGSIFLGSLLVSYLPSEFSDLTTRVLFGMGAAAPAAILIFFVAGSLIGLQPAICFVLINSVVISYANAVGASAAAVLAAMIVGWALNSIVSPFGIPVMIVSGAFKLTSYEFAYRYGYRFLLISVLGCAAVVSVGSILL